MSNGPKKSLKKLLRRGYFKFRKNTLKMNSILAFPDNGVLEKLSNELKNEEASTSFIRSKDRNVIVGLLKSIFPKRAEKIIEEADDICNHYFDLLGSGKIQFGKKIPWHTDFKSGYRWPLRFYLDMLPIDPLDDPLKEKLKYDGKVPYELSRFQHLVRLGRAYWITNNEQYTQEFISEVKDWMEKNPPYYGVNWTCTMEVAIRASNWILGFYFFRNSKEITDEFLIKFLRSLLIHGKYIERNLERSWRGFTSNHYLSDIAGLVYLGIFFKDTKEGQKWLKFGIKELKKEMQKQVYSDGCDFEASTCYHRLVLELFFFSTLLVMINDKDFGDENYKEISEKIFDKEYTIRLYKMFEVVLYLLKPNGRMPQIGDNDNGRLHIFIDREVLDMRYLLTLGAIFFKEPRFKIKEFGFCEEALWIFGENGYKIWRSLKENTLSNVKSKALPNAGWYIMRNNKDYCIISCGPNGQKGNGGHCHNDKLSFELCIDGKDVIVDPGTYVYTPYPEWRNKFRSTAYHNTVVVDNQEQNRFIENNLFSLKNDAKCKCLDFGEDDEKIWFKGKHYGYKRLKNPVVHRREIIFNKKEKKLEIIDKFRGAGQYNLEWNFYFSSEIEMILAENKIMVKKNINFVLDKKVKWINEKSHVSMGYGNKISAQKLSGIYKGDLEKSSFQTINW